MASSLKKRKLRHSGATSQNKFTVKTMKPAHPFSQQEIENLKEGYNQFLKGKIISSKLAKKQFQKWLAKKNK